MAARLRAITGASRAREWRRGARPARALSGDPLIAGAALLGDVPGDQAAGRAVSRKTCWRAVTGCIAVALSSPLRGLRSQRGKLELAISTRRRWPGRRVSAVAQRSIAYSYVGSSIGGKMSGGRRRSIDVARAAPWKVGRHGGPVHLAPPVRDLRANADGSHGLPGGAILPAQPDLGAERSPLPAVAVGGRRTGETALPSRPARHGGQANQVTGRGQRWSGFGLENGV